MKKRYLLEVCGHPKTKVEVTQEEWLAAERGAGFRPKSGDPHEEATASFSDGSVHGWIEYGDADE